MKKTAAEITEHCFISFDETPLFYRRFKPKISPRGVLVIVHGMGEHGGRYEELAQFLAETGVESVAPDLRGFGRSGGKRVCVKHFSDFHRDLLALHAFIVENQKELPIFLLGHSLGGLVVASYAALPEHPKIKGMILSSPNFGIAIPIPCWRHFLGLVASYVLPDFVQSNRVQPETLTHDASLLKQRSADPAILHEISARLYREMTRMIAQSTKIAGRLSGPVLVLQAGEDRIVSREAALDFYAKLKSTDKELEIYEGFYHEILNEMDRATVFSRISQWILEHLNSNSLKQIEL